MANQGGASVPIHATASMIRNIFWKLEDIAGGTFRPRAGSGLVDDSALAEGEAERIENDPLVAKVVDEDLEEDTSGEDVILLRFEFISEKETKIVLLLSFVSVLLAVMATTLVITLNHRFWEDEKIFLYNSIWSGTLLLFIGIAITGGTRRFIKAIKSGRKWSKRQRRTSVMNYAATILTSLLIILVLASNLYGWVDPCSIDFNVPYTMVFLRRIFGLGIFFLTNALALDHMVDKKDPKKLYMDSSWFIHLPHGIVCCVLIGVYITSFVLGITKDHSYIIDEFLELNYCGTSTTDSSSCSLRQYDLAFMIISTAGPLILFFLFCVFIAIALRRLSNLPWAEHRFSNIGVRLLAWTSFTAYFSFIVLAVLKGILVHESCSLFLLNLFGSQDELTLLTVWSCIRVYLYSPKFSQHDRSHFRQVVLQNYILKEECTYGSKIYWYKDQSSRFAPVSYGPIKNLDGQPVFCFETAAKALIWSNIIYLDEQTDFLSKLELAMDLYELEDYQIFHDAILDVKVVVAWGQNVVVTSFRGSDSIKNFWEDLQVWRKKHPRMPSQGKTWFSPWFRECLIHGGFMECFDDSRVGDKVVRLLYALVTERCERGLIFTGHSLGAALTILCAYEITRASKDVKFLQCYTFGSPRVGNRAAAKEIERLVPCLWNVVNNHDMVYRSGKFFKAYKHSGLPVQINSKGDLVVRPTFVESSLQQSFVHWSVKDHFLMGYYQSLLQVCRRFPQLEDVGTVLTRHFGASDQETTDVPETQAVVLRNP